LQLTDEELTVSQSEVSLILVVDFELFEFGKIIFLPGMIDVYCIRTKADGEDIPRDLKKCFEFIFQHSFEYQKTAIKWHTFLIRFHELLQDTLSNEYQIRSKKSIAASPYCATRLKNILLAAGAKVTYRTVKDDVPICVGMSAANYPQYLIVKAISGGGIIYLLT
jgi:hypothetical protein